MLMNLLQLLKKGCLYVIGLTIALFFAFYLYGATMNAVMNLCMKDPKWCLLSIDQQPDDN